MVPLLPLASGAPEAPLLGADTAVLILVTIGVLFLAKTLFAMRREIAMLKSTGAPAAPAKPNAAPPAPAPTGPTPEVRAAIAAAVSVALGHSARIISVTPTLLWSQEGRRQVFQSHRVR